MGRVRGHHVRPGASGAVGPVHHKRAEPKKKPPYKVILEEIAGKKKLKTVLSLREKPPPGYTFIPAGDPQLTNRCKKLAKDEQLTVFIVSTSKHPHEPLSTEVHRIGYHFPSVVVDQACTSLGVTLTQSGRVLQSRFAFINDQGSSNQHQGRRATKGRNKGKKRHASPKLDMSLSQAVIDTTAREAIKDLFPNIPSRDQKEIVGRAFQKGKGLVGTVSELSLVRRAQLAVTAHIRHTYTNYDLLLKSMRWGEARQAVQQQCLDRLVQWRGDDDDDGEMADILQEVIVISDDEEEDQHDAKSRRERYGRSDSVEFISADDINTQAINYAAAKSTTGAARSLSLDSDDADAITYLGHAPLVHSSPVHYNQHRLHQIGAHRHRMWEEAVDRRRKNPGTIFATDNHSPLSAPQQSGPDYYQAQQDTRLQPYGSEPAAHTFDRPSTYTRLIPLPASNGRLSHGSEPRGGETPLFSDQVSHAFQQQQLLPSRIVEEPTTTFTARSINSSYPERPVSRDQPFPVRTQYEDARFVKSQKLRREMLNDSHSHSLQVSSHRQSELILPSIEGGLPIAQDQQPVSSQQLQGMNDFIQQRTDNTEMVRERAFSVVHLDEEEPQTKRRRINDQQPLDDPHPRTVLIPLDHGAENYPLMKSGPAEAMHYQNVPPLALDRRMIQLPPREVRRYEDNQGRIQVMTQNRHVDNRSVYQMPREEHQLQHVKHDVSARPQFPDRSAAFQAVYDQQSPIFFSDSATSYHKVLDQRPSSHDTSRVDEGDARAFSATNAFRIGPQRYDDVGRDMREVFRNLEIEPERYSERNVNINGDINNGRAVHSSLQVSGTTYLPRSPQTDLPVVDRGAWRQGPMNGKSIESRNVQQQHSIQNRAAVPSEWRAPVNAQFTSQQAEKATMNPFRGHTSASMTNQAAVQWSALRIVTHTFTHADTTMSRNRGTQPCEAASMMHAGNALPQTRANTSYTRSENVRPGAQSYRSSGLLKSRLPGEVVVLE